MDISVKTRLTPDDVVRSGACFDGVMEWHAEACPNATVLSVKAALKLCKNETERQHIERAAGMAGCSANGYGANGNGYGGCGGYGCCGNGYGGNGDGYGNGDYDYGSSGDGDGYGEL